MDFKNHYQKVRSEKDGVESTWLLWKKSTEI